MVFWSSKIVECLARYWGLQPLYYMSSSVQQQQQPPKLNIAQFYRLTSISPILGCSETLIDGFWSPEIV